MNITVAELTACDEVYPHRIESRISLKHHQLTSLHRCIKLENEDIDTDGSFGTVKTNIGILADKVGSGKSYVILALFKVNDSPKNCFNKVNVYGVCNSIYVEFKPFHSDILNLNIVVCSFGLIDQWVKYITSFYENPNYVVVNSKKSMSVFMDSYMDKDILLVSATFYHCVQAFLKEKNKSVKRVVFDEADNTAAPNAKQIPSDFYWFVSASYKNIINPYPKYNNMFLHSSSNNSATPEFVSSGVYNNVFIKNMFGSLLRMIPYNVQGILSNIIVKNNSDFVLQSFALPNYVARYIECIDTISELVNSITNNDNIINSVNAGDLETAISFLNKNNKGDEKHIINILKEDLEKNIINCRSAIEYNKSLIVDDVEQQRQKVAQLEEVEKTLVHKTTMLTDRIRNGDICSICFCNQENKTITKCCKNAFCFECICKWLKVQNKCPLCKADIDSIQNDLLLINGDDNATSVLEIPSKYLKPAKKIDTLRHLMNQITSGNKQRKVLIFSEYDKAFVNVAHILREADIKFGQLKGKSLRSNLDLYKNNKLDVLLVNSRSYGSGLNLENTTDIIMYHFFNNEIEQQVIGRAQRPGRTTVLNVWYLFNKGEVYKNNREHVSQTMLLRDNQ
ncbi:hypothetical protein QKU58_gp075 [Pyramimonas orientalis virus]|uniref:RING-type domain-containing protein n=1 Tax=Pyramimonas orientalis virus 01B TaxID=3134525 RepID=A0A7M3UNJ5_9VIRU|nr:hypothetical protein QKU58_gp075 [Pyramimonas orientalis virus]QOI90256.1 hypothetical protein HWQ62_00119 [Pyramimonas orientalis virus]